MCGYYPGLLDLLGLNCWGNRCILCPDIPSLTSADSCCPGWLNGAHAELFIVLQPLEQDLQGIPY